MNLRPCLIAILLASVTSGCASYQPTSAPVLAIPASTASSVADSGPALSIAARLHRNPAGKEELFDTDLDEAGIFAVQLSIRNGTGRTVAVSRSDMTLRLSNGREIGTVSGASVAQRVDEEGSVIGAALAFGLVGLLVASSAEDSAKRSRVSDYNNKEFKDEILAPHESTSGFVFFAPVAGTSSFNSADLIVRPYDAASGAVQTAVVPLSGFGGGRTPAAVAAVSVPAPALAATAMAAAPPAMGGPVASADAYVHAPSGLAFPREAGDFRRVRVSEPSVGGQSLLIADYEGHTAAGSAQATVRVLRPDALGAGGAPAQWCDEQMATVADSVVAARQGTQTAARDVALARGGGMVAGRMMAFRYDFAGQSVDDHFYLFCDIGGGWALSQRLTFPQGEIAPAALEAFVHQVPAAGHATMSPAPMRVAAPSVAPGGSTVTPQTGTPIRDTLPATPAAEPTGDCRPSFGFLGEGYCNNDPNRS
jgi:hypothetical protein